MADTKLSALPVASSLAEADKLALEQSGVSKSAAVSLLRTTLAKTGFIPLDISSLREIGLATANDIGTLANNGGLLSSDSTPAFKRLNLATDKSLMVEWATSDVTEVQFPPVPMPPDLDETVDLTAHLLIRMSGSTDALVTIDIQVWDGIGDTEMGSATGVITSTLAEHTITIANANVSGNPTGVLNVNLVPGGTLHTVDTIQLMSAWIEYTRKAAT